MHPDLQEYFHLATPIRLTKCINTIAGIIEGIQIDKQINRAEVQFLMNWISEYEDLRHKHPYNELIPVVEEAIKDGLLTTEERQDILWLCNKLMNNDNALSLTLGIQRLHAILAGIIADCKINEKELNGLDQWLAKHEHLKVCWPYDEVEALILGVMADKKIDQDEHDMLLKFFAEFALVEDDKTITNPVIKCEDSTIKGVCSVCPEIYFEDSIFCFTGISTKHRRADLARLVESYGGFFSTNMTQKVNYLVIGADGNPCWTYACYGRKVERAVELRKQGNSVQLIHENDFHDAVEDSKRP